MSHGQGGISTGFEPDPRNLAWLLTLSAARAPQSSVIDLGAFTLSDSGEWVYGTLPPARSCRLLQAAGLVTAEQNARVLCQRISTFRRPTRLRKRPKPSAPSAPASGARRACDKLYR